MNAMNTTKETKHTPFAPFTVQDLGLVRPAADYPAWRQYAIRDSRNVCIATVGQVDRITESTSKGIADLFAAAPDLLAALRNLVEAQRCGLLIAAPGWDYTTQAKAAIARAEGE